MAAHQKLPTAGPAREALREKGQFWTPDWVAQAMVAYVTAGNARTVFDPAVGAGAFLTAAKSLEPILGRSLGLTGREIDPAALEQARATGLSQQDLCGVELRDFLFEPPREKLEAIVANPPYIRHHRLDAETKKRLKFLTREIMGRELDGRTGYHIFFLLRALSLLAPFGRLAFITSADICEGVFAPPLWDWIARHFRIEAVVTFAPDATPFPGVDTNPLVFFIKNTAPAKEFWWGRCQRAETPAFLNWALNDLPDTSGGDFVFARRNLAEGLNTGLSRGQTTTGAHNPTLGDFATVQRGVATGANEFFFLTARQIEELGLPSEYFVPALGRTRDVTGERVDETTLQNLEAKGRPTQLLCLASEPFEELPESLQNYLRQGEALQLPLRPLIATRRPWYKMETRAIPPFLFAYLGRRSVRFIENRSGAVPLTGFLCVYPRCESQKFAAQLWQVLQHPQTVENLALVGKSYGSGAIKVEPRALERLPLPPEIVRESGLTSTLPPKALKLDFE